MKLKVGNKVYLQSFEVAHILYDLDGFPPYVVEEITDREKLFLLSSSKDDFSEGCLFDNAFVKQESIDWLMEQEWIIDFDEYSLKSIPELEELVKYLKERRFAIVDAHNRSEKASRKVNFNRVHTRAGKISNEIVSLEMLIRYLKGELSLIFPEDYHLENRNKTNDESVSKKSLLSRLFATK